MLFAQLKMVTRLGGMQGKEHPAKLEVVKWLDQILHASAPSFKIYFLVFLKCTKNLHEYLANCKVNIQLTSPFF